jgi:hypothetical protein
MASLETAKRTITQYYRVQRSEIAFIKFILEAYDGMAMLTTIDPAKGIIALRIAPHCQEQMVTLLQNLKKEVVIQPLTALAPQQHRNVLF